MGMVCMVEVLNHYMRWEPVCYPAVSCPRCVVAKQVHSSLSAGLQLAACRE